MVPDGLSLREEPEEVSQMFESMHMHTSTAIAMIALVLLVIVVVIYTAIRVVGQRVYDNEAKAGGATKPLAIETDNDPEL